MKKSVAELEAEKLVFVQKARDIAAKAEGEDRNLTAEERTEVKSALDDAKAKHVEILALEGDAKMIEDLNVLGLPVGELAKTGTAAPNRSRGKSVGEMVTDAAEFSAWMKSIAPNGTVSEKQRFQSPSIQFGGVKDILAGGVVDGDGAAGALVRPDWLGLLDGLGQFQRPLQIRDLVTIGTTTSDSLSYARVVGFTNNAAPVAEARGASSGTGGGGTVRGNKPESGLELETITTNVKTIAHWLPATKRALSDAAQIRTLIDEFLRYGLAEEFEDQIVSGDNVGENFEGILEVDGTQAQPFDTDLLVTTRKAKTKVRTVGRTIPTAYVFNPEDNERIDLLRDGSGGSENSGAFLFGGPAGVGVQTLWGLPRIESEAVPAGTGLVANWRQAVVWDREQTTISVSDSHEDFFIRNLVAILGEMRAAFGVIRPKAFVEIDLGEGS